MGASGLIYAAFPRGATVGLVVRAGCVVDAPPYCRRFIGRAARALWRELYRGGVELRWLPD